MLSCPRSCSRKAKIRGDITVPTVPFWGKIPSNADTCAFSNRAVFVLFLLPGTSGWHCTLLGSVVFRGNFSTSARSASAFMESMHWGLFLSPVRFLSTGSRSLLDTGCSWVHRSLCSTLVSERQKVCCPLKPKQSARSSKGIYFNFCYYHK